MESSKDGPLVTTRCGTLRGVYSGMSDDVQDVCVFYNIPFAAPPVGNLRFKPPERAEPWEGIRDASRPGLACPQDVDAANKVFFPACVQHETSENCLTLNIYTPSLQGANKAVFVWWHGGSFRRGESLLYDGTAYSALEDVVVVTASYRLGALGFLATESPEYTGNAGLLDQIETLRWVRDNIAVFGGDPNRVTIGGESAGAAIVSLMQLSPMSEGLFNQVIMQSGSALVTNVVVENPNECATLLAKKLGWNGDTVIEDFLCDQPVDDLIEAQEKCVAEGNIFSVVVDGKFLTDYPDKLYREGRFHKVPLLAGVCGQEGAFFVRDVMADPSCGRHMCLESLRKFLHFSLPEKDDLSDLLDAVTDLYFRETGQDIISNKVALVDAASDLFLIAPTYKAAKYNCEFAPTYFYEFCHKMSYAITPTFVEKATHAEELQASWGDPIMRQIPKQRWSFTPEDRIMSRKIVKYWGQFLRTGDPNGSDKASTKWSKLILNSGQVMTFTREEHMKDHFREEKMAFWDKLVFDA